VPPSLEARLPRWGRRLVVVPNIGEVLEFEATIAAGCQFEGGMNHALVLLKMTVPTAHKAGIVCG